MKKVAQSHSFDTSIALECGPIAAIVYNHLYYWINHNRIAGTAQAEGKTWTYQSRPTMLEYLPYLNDKELRSALDKLVEKGYIIKGNFNKNKFDHTTWYSFPDSAPCLPGRESQAPEDSNNSSDAPKRADRESPKGRSMGSERADPSLYIEDLKEDMKQQQQDVVVSKKIFTLSDLYSQCANLKKDWTNEEINSAWKIYENSKNVDYPFEYIEAVILKRRNIALSKKNKEKNSCSHPTHKTETSQEKPQKSNLNFSEFATNAQTLVDIMRDQQSRMRYQLS